MEVVFIKLSKPARIMLSSFNQQPFILQAGVIQTG
jgi:hypothetical protein